MNPFRVLMHWGEVYGKVERRLEDQGAVLELHILHRMSQPELDILVWQELSERTPSVENTEQAFHGEVAA